MVDVRGVAGTLACVAAGAFLTNAVPHSVRGVTGERFPTPFADPPGVGLSSPTENIVWGAVNVVIGGALLRGFTGTAREYGAVAVGATSTALFLARYFGDVATRSTSD